MEEPGTRKPRRSLTPAEQREMKDRAHIEDASAPDASYAAGRWVQVPDSPPVLLPGWTHWHWTVFLAASVFSAIGTALVLVKVAPGAGVLCLVPGIVLIVFAWAGTLRSWRREIAAGYSTIETVFGAPFVIARRNGRLFPASQYSQTVRTKWDDRGLWRLHPRTGQVVRARVRRAMAPGWYPSPNAPGRWEMWSGAEWTGHLHPSDPRTAL